MDYFLYRPHLCGSCLRGNLHYGDIEPLCGSLKPPKPHARALDCVRQRINGELCPFRWKYLPADVSLVIRKYSRDNAGYGECSAICDGGNGTRRLKWRNLKPVLSDGRIISVAETPHVMKNFFFPGRVGDHANFLSEKIHTRALFKPKKVHVRFYLPYPETDTFLVSSTLWESTADFIKVHIGRNGECLPHRYPAVCLPIQKHRFFSDKVRVGNGDRASA